MAGVAAATYLAAQMLGIAALGLVAKPVPALALAVWVATAGRGALVRAVATGLVLSAIGDVLLDLEGRFVPGLLAFLGAHLAFAAGFTVDVRRLAPLRALPFLGYATGMLLFLHSDLGPMFLPVACYALAFTSDMWRAAARVGARGRAARQEWWVLLGTLSFAVSDSLIALDRFHAEISHARVPIIGLYWLGLLGIAAGVATESDADARLGGRP